MTCVALQVPDSGKIYAFNEGNYAGWEKGLQDYMMSLKDPEKHGGKPYSARHAPISPHLPSRYCRCHILWINSRHTLNMYQNNVSKVACHLHGCNSATAGSSWLSE